MLPKRVEADVRAKRDRTADREPAIVAEKIIDAGVAASGGHHELRTSVGLAVFPEDGTTVELLLRTADERLLSAKRRLHAGAQKRAA